jgi:hypothetical protein
MVLQRDSRASLCDFYLGDHHDHVRTSHPWDVTRAIRPIGIGCWGFVELCWCCCWCMSCAKCWIAGGDQRPPLED